MEENNLNQNSNSGEVNQTNNQTNSNPPKIRTFTESEQSSGSYNVGMKKNKNHISDKMKQRLLKTLKI